MFKPRTKPHKSHKRRPSSSSSSESERDREIWDLEQSVKKRKGVESTVGTEAYATNDGPVSTKSPDVHIVTGDDAVRQSELENEKRDQYERVRDIQKRIDSGELEEGVYRGLNAYRAYVQPDDERKTLNAKLTGVFGPSRTIGIVRESSRFDYQADVCKDYKETGYCGFGDSCKFLHDRSDYKTGWELDKEWDESERKRQKQRMLNLSKTIRHDEAADETLQEDQYCGKCKLNWGQCKSPPSRTICGHYFCETCFLSHCSKACAVCGKPTEGIFNSV